MFRMVVPVFIFAVVLGAGLISRGRVGLGVFWILAFALLTALTYLMPKQQARAAFKRFPYLQQEITAEINDDGLMLTMSSGGAEFPWEAFTGFRENKEVMVLRRADSHVQVIPLRALTAAEQQQLRDLVHQNIKARRRE